MNIYNLPTAPPIYQHITGRAAVKHRWFNDSADGADTSNLLIEARLRSGDYFETLATELERLATLLDRQKIPEADALRHYASELSYLEKHYTVQHK